MQRFFESLNRSKSGLAGLFIVGGLIYLENGGLIDKVHAYALGILVLLVLLLSIVMGISDRVEKLEKAFKGRQE